MPSRRLLLSAIALLTLVVLLSLLGRGFLSSGDPALEEGKATLTPTVLLISLDGFRWDYLERYDAPTLKRLAAEGVRARQMIPSFPTKTFPNHYTIVTGLYPEHHGIVSNTMYDPEMDASFSIGNREAQRDGRWWEGEPLWVTAEKQNQTSATYFWPGTEAEIQGVRPTYWGPYDGRVPGPERVDQVLAWLDLPQEERPTFVTLYFSTVDSRGHASAPVSDEVAAAVRTVDGHLARLVEGLKTRGLYDDVNIIVVSDHGMVETSPERVVLLDDYIALDDVHIVEYSPVLMLRPKAGRDDAVYEGLREAPHLTVYRKEDLPDAFHYRAHHRIPPLLGIADEGWSISTRAFVRDNPNSFRGATHGYDHRLPSMQALFVARGPAFIEGVVVEPFANVHLYSLMTHILGLEPAPNDGDLGAVQHLLQERTPELQAEPDA